MTAERITDAAKRLEYMPALDGLRAVFVFAVVGYHSGLELLSGGFLAVSAFFTLSGFLITAQLLAESQDNRPVGVVEFWRRRFVRLAPAAALVVAVVVVVGATTDAFGSAAATRSDGIASLLQVFNWWTIAEGTTYGDQFAETGALVHYWSLAVEEQFYVLFPIGAAALLGLGRRGRPRLARNLLAFTIVSALLWPVAVAATGASSNRLYLGTDTRIGEILVGCGLGWLWHVRRHPTPVRWSSVGTSFAVTAASGTVLVMWSTANPTDRWLFFGGLALHATLIGLILVWALVSTGWFATVLSVRLLRRLGVWSYAIYLVHWPVLVVLDRHYSQEPVLLFIVGGSVSIVLAAGLHRWVEHPLRRRRNERWTLGVTGALLTVSLLAAVVLADSTQDIIDFDAAVEDFAAATAVTVPAASPPESDESDEPVASGPEAASRPLRVAMFGDSTALMTGIGINQWSIANPASVEFVGGVVDLGCGLQQDGVRKQGDETLEVPLYCADWLTEWAEFAALTQPDVAVIQLGPWEVVDFRVDGDDSFTSLQDDKTREAMTAQLDGLVASVIDEVAVVVLILPPDIGPGHPNVGRFPETDPARMQRWRDITFDVAERHNEAITADLAAWIKTQDDEVVRPDGVHFDRSSALNAASWLVPTVIDRYGLPAADDAVDGEYRVLVIGDYLARPIAEELSDRYATETSTSVGFAYLPKIPRDDAAQASWETRLDVARPDVAVFVLEPLEESRPDPNQETAARSDVEGETRFADVAERFFDQLGAEVDVIVIAFPGPFDDENLDNERQHLVAALVTLAAERDTIVTLELPPATVFERLGQLRATYEPETAAVATSLLLPLVEPAS